MSEPPSFDLQPEHDVEPRSGIPAVSTAAIPFAGHPRSRFRIQLHERVINDLIIRQLQQQPKNEHHDSGKTQQIVGLPSSTSGPAAKSDSRQFHMTTRHFAMHGWIERPAMRVQSGTILSPTGSQSTSGSISGIQPLNQHEEQTLRFICDCFGGVQVLGSGRIFSLSGIVRIDFRPRLVARGGHWQVGLLFDHLDLDDLHITYGDGPVPTKLLQEAHAAFSNFRVEFRRTFIKDLEECIISYAFMHKQLPMTKMQEPMDINASSVPLIPLLSATGKSSVAGLVLYASQRSHPTADQNTENSASPHYQPNANSTEYILPPEGSANTPLANTGQLTNSASSPNLQDFTASQDHLGDLLSEHPSNNLAMLFAVNDIQNALLSASTAADSTIETSMIDEEQATTTSALLRECTSETDPSRLHQILTTLQPLIQPLLQIQLLVPGTNIDYMAIPSALDIIGDLVVALYIIPDHTQFQPLLPALKPDILLTLQGTHLAPDLPASGGVWPSNLGTTARQNPGPGRDIWQTTLLKPSFAPYDYYWRIVHQSRGGIDHSNRSQPPAIAGTRVSNNVLIEGTLDTPGSEVHNYQQYLIDWHQEALDQSSLDDLGQNVPRSSATSPAGQQIAVTVIDCYGQTAQTLRQLPLPTAAPLAAARLRRTPRSRNIPSVVRENSRRAGIVALVALTMLILLCRATMSLTKLPLGFGGSASQQRISQLQPTLPATQPPYVEVPQPTTPPTALPVIQPTPRPAPTPTLRPLPQPTHTPIPTPVPIVAFALAHTTYTQTCDANLSPLASIAITLDNSQSTVAVDWSISIQQLAPNTAHLWAVAAPAQGKIPAHGTVQIMLQPAPTLCSALINMTGTSQNLTFNAPLVITGLTTTTTYTLADSIQPPTMQLVATPAAYAVTCATTGTGPSGFGALAPAAFVLDNSASSININWTATVIGTFATTNGAQPWASLNAGTGTIAAGQHGSISVTPAPSICQALFGAGAAPPQTYTVNIVAMPAAPNVPTTLPTSTPSIISYTINPPPINAFAITANPLTQTCPVAPSTVGLGPITIQLDNSKSTVAVNWTLTIDPSTLLPTGVTWATAPAGQTSGIVPAGGAMTVTLTPLANLCTFVTTTTDFTATITTQPAGTGPVIIKETISP